MTKPSVFWSYDQIEFDGCQTPWNILTVTTEAPWEPTVSFRFHAIVCGNVGHCCKLKTIRSFDGVPREKHCDEPR